MARIRFVWMLLVAGVLVQAQEIEITPSGQPLIIGLGTRQTILCNVTVHDASIKPRWVAPVNATYKSENKSTTWPGGTFTIELNIIFESFREEDAGVYTCTFQETASHAWESKTTLVAGCPYGKYGDNSNNCINCSPNCATSADPHISPCNLTDGTCVAGCREGYSGRNCTQTVPKEDDGGTVGTIVGVVVAVAVVVVGLLITAVAIYYCRRTKRACFVTKGDTENDPETNDGPRATDPLVEGGAARDMSSDLNTATREPNELRQEDVNETAPSVPNAGDAINDTDINDGHRPTDPVEENEERTAMDTSNGTNMAPTAANGPRQEDEGDEVNQTARPIPSEDTSTQTQEEKHPLAKVTQENTSQAVDRIRYIFRQHINPLDVINVFHHFDSNVLTDQDIEHVTIQAKNNGRFLGADDLLSRLCHYQGWYECLQKVLRNGHVKLTHVANEMNKLLKDL